MAWLGPMMVVALAAHGLSTNEQVREGPPTRQIVKKGTIGASIDYEDFREIYYRSRDLEKRRHPFDGSEYASRPYRVELMQGQAVFRYRERRLWLVHNFFCWQMAGTAQMPWSCEATVFILKGGRPVTDRPPSEQPRRHEEGGFTLLDPEDSAEVSGDFDAVDPHPSQPLFGTVQRGCCGSESRVSIHHLDGRRLCWPSDLLIGWDSESPDNPGAGTWDKVRIEKGRVYCPDGTRVSIEPAVSENQGPGVRGSGRRSRFSRAKGR